MLRRWQMWLGVSACDYMRRNGFAYAALRFAWCPAFAGMTKGVLGGDNGGV